MPTELLPELLPDERWVEVFRCVVLDGLVVVVDGLVVVVEGRVVVFVAGLVVVVVAGRVLVFVAGRVVEGCCGAFPGVDTEFDTVPLPFGLRGAVVPVDGVWLGAVPTPGAVPPAGGLPVEGLVAVPAPGLVGVAAPGRPVVGLLPPT